MSIHLFLRYANELYGDKVNLFYSTPSCYLKALHDADLTWPEKSDDFFPYASDPHTYWTGYFTSRPTQKRYERVGNHFNQVCKQLTALSPKSHDFLVTNLNKLRDVMGIFQHHDSITGTEKQHVADNYALLMDKALRGCEMNARQVLDDIFQTNLKFENCLLLNISQCAATETDSSFHIATLYNPTAQSRSEMVRVPVTNTNFYVLNANKVKVPHQLVPVPQSVLKITNRTSKAKFELIFKAKDIPALSVTSYFIVLDTKLQSSQLPNPIDADEWRGFSIGNEYLKLKFDRFGSLIQYVTQGLKKKLTHTFAWYEGALGNNAEFKNRSSGAYIFRPNNTARTLSPSKFDVYRGPIVEEVHQIFNEWVSQVIRVYKGQRHAEFEWLVGPIPFADGLGKELVSKFSTDMVTDGVFYTDSNGREMLKRVRNQRDTWNVTIVEPEAGNYYPITNKIAIEDQNNRLAILNDRAQGGSSLRDGEIELMIHRRLLRDDAFGVEEALNETVVARGRHYLLFNKKSLTHPTPHVHERLLQSHISLAPWQFVADTKSYKSTDLDGLVKKLRTKQLLASYPLPANVRLLSLEPWPTSKQLLVRFEHIFEINEDPEFSKPIELSLKKFFGNVQLSARETTLDGNQWINKSMRLKFNVDGGNKSEYFEKSKDEDWKNEDDFTFVLNPMQIKTFIVNL